MTCQYDIHHGDIVEWCHEYSQLDDAEMFHAVLCDPPYHLTSIVERFSSKNSKPAKHGRDGAFARVSKGFMGQCYSVDTEIYTEDGWKYISDIVHNRYSGKVYSIDPDTWNVEWTKITDYHKFWFDGDLLLFENDDIDLLVTPNHKLVVADGESISFVRADNVNNKITMIASDTGAVLSTIDTIQKYRYQNNVYDITVDRHHTLLTRRNGKRVWSSNSWDGGDIAFRPETWHAISTVMHPGAFGMAAAGSRGYHRMAVAIENSLIGNTTDSIVIKRNGLLQLSRLLEMAIESEDWDLVVEAKDIIDHFYRLKSAAQMAGFIIHPAIGWVTIQGFPKGTRIDTQIDEAAGIKIDRGYSFNYKGSQGHPEAENWKGRPNAHHEPQTEMAKIWTNHRYGLQALRPLFEFYAVFQKPYPSGIKPYQSIVNTGAGAFNIDAGWVENGGGAYRRNNSIGQNGNFNSSGGEIESDGGRWPPNLILDESYVEWSNISPDKLVNFYVTDWMLDRLEDDDPLVFAAKAGIPEREAGLDPMARRLMREMYKDDYSDDDLEILERDVSGLVYEGYYGKNMPFKDEIEKSTINDGRQADSDRPYLCNQTERYNIHPTIKPISLCEYLSRVLSPPDHYAQAGRRLLVPFSGSGSEICGAVISGKWEYVQGVELEEKHVKIAHARITFWMKMREQYGDQVLSRVRLSVKGKSKSKKKKTDHEQAEMF